MFFAFLLTLYWFYRYIDAAPFAKLIYHHVQCIFNKTLYWKGHMLKKMPLGYITPTKHRHFFNIFFNIWANWFSITLVTSLSCQRPWYRRHVGYWGKMSLGFIGKIETLWILLNHISSGWLLKAFPVSVDPNKGVKLVKCRMTMVVATIWQQSKCDRDASLGVDLIMDRVGYVQGGLTVQWIHSPGHSPSNTLN